MKGNPTINQELNKCLKFELTAINQSFLHSRIYRIWGLNSLADMNYKTSIAAMKSADNLIDRILFLSGLPNVQDLGKLLIGENVNEMLECDMSLTSGARQQFQNSISTCESCLDYESRSILVTRLEEIEELIDWLESQEWLIASMGVENYTQSQIGGDT